MATENPKRNFRRKALDYIAFGSGIAAITDGIASIANNPPQQLINGLNFNDGNWQYQVGCIDIIIGGAVLAYGIERIVCYCAKKE